MGKHFVLCEAETDFVGVEIRNTAHCSVVGTQEVERQRAEGTCSRPAFLESIMSDVHPRTAHNGPKKE
jgi:hypothetical protein